MSQKDTPDWSIELLRGVAAMLVVLAHYGPLVAGDLGILQSAYTGVDLFFVLSGYVFGPYFFGRAIPWRAFAIRRVFRIFPLYWVALVCYAAVKWQFGLPVLYLLEHTFLMHTWVSPEIAFYYNAAFWSLPVELEYYLFLGLMAPLLQGRKKLGGLLALALVAHFLVIQALPSEGESKTVTLAGILFYHLPGMLVEFIIGAVTWAVVIRWQPAMRVRLLLVALAGLSLLVLGWFFRHSPEIFVTGPLRGNLSLLAALAYSLLVAGLAKWPNAREAAVRSGLAMGNLSYGIYLFHNLPLSILGHGGQLASGRLDGVQALVLFGIVLLLAITFNRLIERPSRALGRGWAKRTTK